MRCLFPYFQQTPACSCRTLVLIYGKHLISEVPLYVDEVKPCLFQPKNWCHVKRKTDCSQTVCMHMFLLAACISHSNAQSLAFSINIFLSSLDLLDEPSVQKFETAINKVLLFVLTWFLLDVSRFFWLHKQDCSAFADTKYKWEHFSFFFFFLASYFTLSNNILLSPNCHFCYLIVLLIPFKVHGSVCCVTLVSPGLQHQFILTAAILCTVSHWWVMMVQLVKLVSIKSGATHHLAASRQLH